MRSSAFHSTAIDAPPELRAEFLTRTGAWTLGGLVVTAIVSVVSLVFVVPAVLQFGTFAILGVVYGSMFVSQSVARNMVYGENKLAGFLLGTGAQGVSFGFILFATLFGFGAVSDGLLLIGQCMLMVVLTGAAMFIYVTMARRDFSLLGAGLSMLFIPMLALMAIQLVWPIGGLAGILLSGLFVAISAGSLLYKLNFVVHKMDTSQSMEGGYDLSLSIIVLLWNLLALFNRLRR
ncbi:MAG: hypothetical protein EXR69_01715 [Myxococcales bacterium]|nr:hypothetical protein [Myxococcales bacterium]